MQAKTILAQRPASFDQYVDLVEQALFEIENLRSSVEFDEEFMEGTVFLSRVRTAEYARLRETMQNGTYRHAEQDLPFVALVESQGIETLPFKNLLRVINATHRSGLRED